MTIAADTFARGASLPLVAVNELRVSFGAVEAVDGVCFQLAPAEVLGIVGESGCGKTATARSVIGLNRSDPHCRVSGQVLFKGRDLIRLSERQLRTVRGREIAMIFQDPLSSLNPLHRIGTQVAEVLREHTDLSEAAIRARAVDLLRLVGIPQPEQRAQAFPHQFSGGMRQRAMIALAIACSPTLLIADEPTTALDVTTQMQILRLLRRLRDAQGMAIILITHDLGVVAEIADRVMVMYAGQCVETGEVAEIFHHPQHPYTAGLLASIPAADRPRVARMTAIRGAPPSLAAGRPDGCAFRPRCDHAQARCAEAPPLASRSAAPTHFARCWRPTDARASTEAAA
jgi:oligopeptide/dipeptide ABC transporter ATP-binding protein